MRCWGCGSFITTVGDNRCQRCCKSLIDAALSALKDEDEEIQRFIEIDIQHEALRKRVETIYMARVERALMTPPGVVVPVAERAELAIDRVRDCPDGLTKAFAADRIRQFKMSAVDRLAQVVR